MQELEVVRFGLLDGIVKNSLPYRTTWQLRGESGTGKSTFAFQFTMGGLRRGESVIYLACDTPVRNLRNDFTSFGFVISQYEEAGQLKFVESYESEESGVDFIKDASDVQEFIYVLAQLIDQMAKPCRVIIDSMTAVAVNYSTQDLVAMVHEKNRLLRKEGVVMLDLYLKGTLEETGMYGLANAYDVCIDLYYPEEKGGVPQRNMRVHKIRSTDFDPRPFPFSIRTGQGLVVDKKFYSR